MAGGLAELTDGALVERHLVGRPEGFEALYRRFWPRLVVYLDRLTGDRALAEDVAQEALLRAYAHLGRFDVGRPMWPWLKTIALHLALDHGRTRTPEARLDEVGETSSEHDDPAVGERELLAAALARVPARQRVALGLRYVHDWTPSEAADFLGMNRTAFEQLLFRGRQRLRVEYERATRGVTDRLGVLAGPFLVAARRARLAFQRRQSAVVDGVGNLWARFDPMNAIGAAVCTSVACHIAVVTFAGLGAVGAGGAEGPALAGPRPIVAVDANATGAPGGWPFSGSTESSGTGGASGQEAAAGSPAAAPGGRGLVGSGADSPLPPAHVYRQDVISASPNEGNSEYRDHNPQAPAAVFVDPDDEGPHPGFLLGPAMVGWSCNDEGPEHDAVFTALCLPVEAIAN